MKIQRTQEPRTLESEIDFTNALNVQLKLITKTPEGDSWANYQGEGELSENQRLVLFNPVTGIYDPVTLFEARQREQELQESLCYQVANNASQLTIAFDKVNAVGIYRNMVRL